MDRRRSVDHFYELLAVLKDRCGGPRQLSQCDGRMRWPRRGVYFFFEGGEQRRDTSAPRVVRVGTHGLRPSSSTLWGRLSQHRGTTRGRYAGGGNHRGSVFRLHVGAAILDSHGGPTPMTDSWSARGPGVEVRRVIEHPLETMVSEYIGRMPFLWVGVEDPPSKASDRGVIERGAIALLSNHERPPVDAASPSWLGRLAMADAIRGSGLWNVNHVADSPDPSFLEVLESHVESM